MIKSKKILITISSLLMVLFVGFGVKYLTSPKYEIKKIANKYMDSLKKGTPETLLLSEDVKNSLDANWINDYNLTDYSYQTSGLPIGATGFGVITYKIDINGETKVIKIVVTDKKEPKDFLITFIVPM